jgi:YidC/Oxa1 family membrane protein insertase
MFSWIWTNVLYNPILNISLSFYHLLGDNLGIAIIVIAILFRLIFLPLVKNQTEMTRKMAALKPQLDALEKKYGNNKEKLALRTDEIISKSKI